MKYQLVEEIELNQKNAISKARKDVECILEREGFEKITVSVKASGDKQNMMMKLIQSLDAYRICKKGTRRLKRGDQLLVQFPVMIPNPLLYKVICRLNRKGIQTMALIHDLELIRFYSYEGAPKKHIQVDIQEKYCLKKFSAVVAHNERMKEYLAGQGIEEDRIRVLGIFDYLVSTDLDEKKKGLDKPVILAGNLSRQKAGYIWQLGDIPADFNLYGVGCEDVSLVNAHYFGSYPADELPQTLEGSFGLIWDGDRIDTCSGVFGKYMLYNNPHKISMFLACGFPVIIWSQAALADFVLKNRVGFTIDQLSDIPDKISRMGSAEYESMLDNVRRLSAQLREGRHTLAACSVKECV